MLDYSTRSHRGVRTRASCDFGSIGTSSLAVRPSDLVENNLSHSNFEHGLPETGNLKKNSNNNIKHCNSLPMYELKLIGYEM